MDILNDDCYYVLLNTLNVYNINKLMSMNKYYYKKIKNHFIWKQLFFALEESQFYFYYDPYFYTSYKLAYIKKKTVANDYFKMCCLHTF